MFPLKRYFEAQFTLTGVSVCCKEWVVSVLQRLATLAAAESAGFLERQRSDREQMLDDVD